MKSVFRIINQDEFPAVYELMQRSFPPAELRMDADAAALFGISNYRVQVVEGEKGIQAFIAEWILQDFRYMEHFAVIPEVRGQGLGTDIMRDYLGQSTRPVVLEVEAADTPIAKRRIEFYQRLGFCLSDIEYIQPLLTKNAPDVLLRLMYYPAKLSNEAICDAKQRIFQEVYHFG